MCVEISPIICIGIANQLERFESAAVVGEGVVEGTFDIREKVGESLPMCRAGI